VIATAEDGWLLTPDGPLHRLTAPTRTVCGERLAYRTGVPASLLACLVHRVPICVHCWPDIQTRKRP
jgi:hypothetical protein